MSSQEKVLPRQLIHPTLADSVELAFGHQDVNYTALYRYGDYKLRVSLRSDSYKAQSWAKIEVWDFRNLRWNALWSIHPGSMNTPEGLYYKRDQPRVTLISMFKVDVFRLLEKARELLGPIYEGWEDD